MKILENYKGINGTNPIFTQHYGADPYAMVFEDTVYFYMTADQYEYDEKGEIKENSYSKIKSLYVVSTKDMVNFEDHGEITVACDAAAKWAANSWAPAAAWKMIDGKPKFFLYFADNGGGIGVLSSDSPIGPFTDPLGHGLIRRDMENCGNVEWLFDPAVLVDDDGSAYIYFGGGVPAGKASAPGTGRVAKLGADMISLDCVPVAIDIPYLFEDSGIHKFGNKYYYTYCSNFSVDEEGTKKYGMKNGEICVMESDSPMGPFVYKEVILENPGDYCGLYGNNHHCVFSFKDKWYITYHSRSLEKAKGVRHGYRVTHIDEFTMNADGSIGKIKQTFEGRKQLMNVNPYIWQSAVNMSSQNGCYPVPADEVSKEFGCGHMILSKMEEGGFIEIQGVDFGDKSPAEFMVDVKKDADCTLKFEIYVDDVNSDSIAVVDASLAKADAFETVSAPIKKSVTGVHNVIIAFTEGKDSEFKAWMVK